MVDTLRSIRESVSNDIKDLSFTELIEYLENKKALHPKMQSRHRTESV